MSDSLAVPIWGCVGLKSHLTPGAELEVIRGMGKREGAAPASSPGFGWHLSGTAQ